MGITTTTTDRAFVWANHMQIKSETSSRLYTVAECVSGKNAGTWACDCPGFKAHKKVNPRTGRVTCKHLDNMALLGPLPATTPAPRASRDEARHSFSDEAYEHYDTSDGFGSPEDWFEQAERMARGRGRYKGDPGERTDSGYRRPRTDDGRRRREDDRQRARPRPSYSSWQAEAMRLLGLDRMPDHVDGLKEAMRAMAKRLHPNYHPHLDTHEGRVAFTAMMDAFKRLLEFY